MRPERNRASPRHRSCSLVTTLRARARRNPSPRHGHPTLVTNERTPVLFLSAFHSHPPLAVTATYAVHALSPTHPAPCATLTSPSHHACACPLCSRSSRVTTQLKMRRAATTPVVRSRLPTFAFSQISFLWVVRIKLRPSFRLLGIGKCRCRQVMIKTFCSLSSLLLLVATARLDSDVFTIKGGRGVTLEAKNHT